MYCLALSSLEVSVRTASSNHGVSVINYYIIQGLENAKLMKENKDTKNMHIRIYNVLLETMCDACLPRVWRETCYTYLKKLEPLMAAIYSFKEFKHLRDELNTLHQYFFTQTSAANAVSAPAYCFTFENKS